MEGSDCESNEGLKEKLESYSKELKKSEVKIEKIQKKYSDLKEEYYKLKKHHDKHNPKASSSKTKTKKWEEIENEDDNEEQDGEEAGISEIEKLHIKRNSIMFNTAPISGLQEIVAQHMKEQENKSEDGSVQTDSESSSISRVSNLECSTPTSQHSSDSESPKKRKIGEDPETKNQLDQLLQMRQTSSNPSDNNVFTKNQLNQKLSIKNQVILEKAGEDSESNSYASEKDESSWASQNSVV